MPAINRYYSSVAVDTTLSFSISSSDLTLTVGSTAGFPTSYPYTLALGYDLSNEELVTIIAASGTTLTVGTTVAGGANIAGRGVDGTNDQAHTAGEPVKHVISARDMTEAQAHIAGEADVHGLAVAGPAGASGGTVVGTTASQTLTNKTITGGTVNATTLQQGGVPAVTTTGTQTLTAKTLTSPAITDATITGTTTATSGTIALGTNASAITADSKTISATEIGYLDGVTSALQTQLTTNTPVGAVNMWVTSTAPTGWLLCDGSTKSTATNPELAGLYAVIGTTYGGSGTTDFKLPDLRGRVPMGAGQGRNVADNANLAISRTLGNKVSDDQTVALTIAQLAQHTHIQNSHEHLLRYRGSLTGGTDGYVYGDLSGGGSTSILINPVGFGGLANSVYTSAFFGAAPALAEATTATNQVTGSNEAHNNTQPSTVINFIIKF